MCYSLALHEEDFTPPKERLVREASCLCVKRFQVSAKATDLLEDKKEHLVEEQSFTFMIYSLCFNLTLFKIARS